MRERGDGIGWRGWVRHMSTDSKSKSQYPYRFVVIFVIYLSAKEFSRRTREELFHSFLLSFHEILPEIPLQLRVKLTEVNKTKSKQQKKIYLYISVYNLVLMEILKAFQNLLGVKFNCGFFHWTPLRSQESREAAYVI